MSVNPDYVRVNAAAEVKDPNSTYHFWASVLGLRKKYLDIFVYGDWVQVDEPNEEVFAFTRQYENQKALVVCNFTAKAVDWDAGSNEVSSIKEVILNNYDSTAEATQRFGSGKWSLRPYEAIVALL
jgi:glycosidase